MATKENKPEVKKTDVKKSNGKKKFDLIQYFKEMIGEVKKLTWLSKKELLSHTVAVFVFVIVMALIIYGLDFVFSTGIGALESINIAG